MSELEISEHQIYDPAMADQYDALVASLKRDVSAVHSREAFEALIHDEMTKFYLGYLGGRAVGSAVLVGPYSIMSKRVAVIEDVAVVPEARNQQVATRLFDHVEATAWKLGATTIQLHSHPGFRREANKMYASRGYGIHDTNVFVLGAPE